MQNSILVVDDCTKKWSVGQCVKTHNLRGVRMVGPSDYHTLTIDFPLSPHITYYLLVVDYNTGDSSANKYHEWEVVDLYSTDDKAQENAQRIKDDADDCSPLLLIRENGQILEASRVWCFGYHESLNNVLVLPVFLIE